MPYDPPPELASLSLAEIAAMVAEKKLPPVEQWNPEHCGDSDMRIAADGTWFYRGTPIGRAAMVRLFSTVLRRERDGSYVLVTPVEKLDIEVEDVPFIAVELTSEGKGRHRKMAFRLNTDHMIVASATNALRFEDRPDGPHPYVHVRGGMEALVTRSVYYELVNLALEEESDTVGLWSEGCFFPLLEGA